MFKKLLLVTLLCATNAFAGPHHNWRHGYHGYYGHHGHDHGKWIVPALIGGTVVYLATRPQPAVAQPPIIVQQPIILQSNQVLIDGIIYNKQIMIINGVHQEVLVRQ